MRVGKEVIRPDDPRYASLQKALARQQTAQPQTQQSYADLYQENRTRGLAESRDPTYEDILTSLQKKLGDYLQDVATAVQQDPDLLDKLPKQVSGIQAVKTIRTDDGHEIKIHGNEDDGFRISIRNRDIKTSFEDLDEAVMACEIYCARRRHKDYLDEKSVTESYSEQEYAQAMQDFLARGGKIEKGVYKEPKLATRLRRQGSRHIGQGSEGRAGQLAGRGANIGGTGKPVVSVEETKKDACYNKVKSPAKNVDTKKK